MDKNRKFEAGDIRWVIPKFTEDARNANQALIKVIAHFAEIKGATNPQIALAWVLARNPMTVPIPGTTKIHRWMENNASTNIEFSETELSELTETSEKVKVMGARYTEAQEKATGL